MKIKKRKNKNQNPLIVSTETLSSYEKVEVYEDLGCTEEERDNFSEEDIDDSNVISRVKLF